MAKKEQVKSEIRSFLWVIVFALVIRTFLIEIFFVPTGSMKETILEGDYIFATKYNYGYSNYSFPFYPNVIKDRIWDGKPSRGDVVIMQPDEHISPERYIKRLIGMPGDKIQIKNDLIYINDKAIEKESQGSITSEQGEEFFKFKETLPNGVSYYSYKAKQLPIIIHRDIRNFGPYTVPDGHYFFLGDNRDNSGDSRYQLGMVAHKRLIAKAQCVLFSNSILMWDSSETILGQIKRIGRWFVSFRIFRSFQSMYETRS